MKIIYDGTADNLDFQRCAILRFADDEGNYLDSVWIPLKDLRQMIGRAPLRRGDEFVLVRLPK